MPRLFLDVSPLRDHPEFRRLWLGNALSSIGTQLSTVAVAYEVFVLSRSDFDVGLVSLIQLVPSIFGSVIGGSIADSMDRRKLLACTNTSMVIVSSAMAFDVDRRHPSLVLLYVLAGALAAFQSLTSPALTALQLSIVGRATILKANALTQLSRQLSSVIGPGIAGIMIAAFGTKSVFWANAGSFLFIIAAVVSVGKNEPIGGTTKFGWKSMVEGFAFLKGRQAIQGCFIADLNATILGMPTALFPAFALQHFHGGARIVGLLYTAPGIGAFLGAGLSGWTHRIRRPGFAVCVAVAVWGLALTGFGLVDSVVAAVVCLAVAGGADMISAIFRSTILQLEAPDRLRGRLTSIQGMVVQSGPRLGNTEAGLVASLSTAQISVVSGGIGCVIGIALVARLMPRFVHYRIDHQAVHRHEPAVSRTGPAKEA